ncbi:uncharacterized protein K444DRAFT_287146 [Hyaloscypha bicolor E]|uniref:Uncharacterized protein n=1 Tax=Hyaloscypha bicolor E TaxID=1095630 RepID=A0A2J6SGT4_9HELO|nr:uncharacterized protein K444DRAFT_287146 [Hyaloscypha bicolor E]PMD49969.1 hypothetical protein K444DRAFT_287146 [Hyaloscypha bicolor E]
MADRTNLNAAIEKFHFQLLMRAYNSEDVFYVALHHLQANWPGMFNKVMNTTRCTTPMEPRRRKFHSSRAKTSPPQVAAIKMNSKIVLRTTAAAELAI